jgi:hypothetical protein
MSKEKEYTKEDIISILDFAKDKNIQPEKLLRLWTTRKNNQIDQSDEHGLSVVGIFEHPITNKHNKEIGKIIMFNYFGVGGGWHNDIYKMVEQKYFSDESFYSFIPEGNDGFYYRFYLIGDIFSDDNFDLWDKPTDDEDFRVFKCELPNSELIIIYDASDKRDGLEMKNNLRSNREYCMYYDYSACQYYIKNISGLKYEKSKPIIEQRIRDRKIELVGI